MKSLCPKVSDHALQVSGLGFGFFTSFPSRQSGWRCC